MFNKLKFSSEKERTWDDEGSEERKRKEIKTGYK